MEGTQRRWLAVFASLALPTLGLHDSVAGQKPLPHGESCQAEPAPTGYPTDLVSIPAGVSKLGIDMKEAREIAKDCSHGNKVTQAMFLRLLAREMGIQETRVPAFLLGRHEVTNRQYEAFVRASKNKVRFPFDWWKQEDLAKHREAFYQKQKGKKTRVSFVPKDYWEDNFMDLDWEVPKGKENHPVAYVSFAEAQAYCSWAGVRLPYEAEWQLALQGNTNKPTRYIWGKKWEGEASLEKLRLRNIRDVKKRPVGKAPTSRSCFGVEDMLGGVWEWTQSPFLEFSGFNKQLKQLQRALRKKKQREVPYPVWRADQRIVRGGSFLSRGQANIVFRSNTRRPLERSQTIEDLGFRIAKSLVPALDATVIRYRRDFNTDSLNDSRLDLPNLRDIRKGPSKTFEQRGIERWDLDGDIIKGYQMVSVAPVTELAFRNEKELTRKSIESLDDGAIGLPIGAVFSDIPLQVQQGFKKMTSMNAGMYTVSYRHKGLPRDLEIALHAGSRELKLKKKAPKKGDKKAEEKKKKDNAKKKGKKKKKGKEEQEPKKKIDWRKLVEHHGISEEVVAKWPKEKSKLTEITVHPGSLKIPLNKNILLFRNHDGDYVAWAEYRRNIRRANAKSSKVELKLDGDKLEYVGGPRTVSPQYRFEFKLAFKLAEDDAKKTWITPAMLVDAKRRVNTTTPVNAKTNGAKDEGAKTNGDKPNSK